MSSFRTTLRLPGLSSPPIRIPTLLLRVLSHWLRSRGWRTVSVSSSETRRVMSWHPHMPDWSLQLDSLNSLIQQNGSNNHILGSDPVHNVLVPVVLINITTQVDTRTNDPAVLKILPGDVLCCDSLGNTPRNGKLERCVDLEGNDPP